MPVVGHGEGQAAVGSRVDRREEGAVVVSGC